jgi:hypothetical protein
MNPFIVVPHRSTQRRILLILLAAGLPSNCGSSDATEPGTTAQAQTAEEPPPAAEAESATSGQPPTTSTSSATAAVSARPDLRVTVVNPSAFPIRVTLTTACPEGGARELEISEIASSATGSASVPLCDHDTLVVTAHWTNAAGAAATSRPFTVPFTPEDAAAPAVSLTLNVPRPEATMGVWSSVVWEPPPE